MQKIKKNRILIIFGVLIFLLLTFAVLLLKIEYNKEDYSKLNAGWHIEINDVVYEDVTLGEFRFPILNKGDLLKMSCHLPTSDIVANPVICIYTIHSDIEVRYNNQIKYTYGKTLREENKLLGYGYHFIFIPAYYAGAKIEVTMHITEDDAFSNIQAPEICNSETVFRDFIMKNRVPLAVNMFLILFGALVTLASIIFCFYNKRFFKLLCVGCFSFGIGCWSFCNYDLTIFFTYDLRVKAYLEFAALYISPLFVLLYFWKDGLVTRNKIVEGIYKALLGMQICFDVAAFTLQITNIVHFPAVLRIQHLILFLLCIGVIVLTIHDIIRKQLNNKILIAGITVMLVIGLIDMIRFSIQKYVFASDEVSFTSNLCVGALLFVFTQMIDFCTEIVDIFLKGAKAQVLEQMAYVDDMTGVANRRKCEEIWDNLDQCNRNYGIFAFDLNFLKKTNDTKGHAMGDVLIQTFAKKLSEVFDKTGIVGRIGGDEFVVFIPDMKNIEISELTKQLEHKIEQTNVENPELNLSTAYGFCSHEQYPAFDSRKLYRKADSLMYEKKVAMKAARRD